MQFYTLHEVADILRIPYEVVRDAVYAGRWPHTAFTPRNRRMSQDDIDQVVQMLHHAPADEGPQTTQSKARGRSKRVQDLLRAV